MNVVRFDPRKGRARTPAPKRDLVTPVIFGVDGTGSRTLATIRIAGHDVGDILIAEGLARRWPDGDEFWC